MYRTEDVLATLGMVRQHKLDVRTVTLGVDLHGCASPNLSVLCGRIRDRLLRHAGRGEGGLLDLARVHGPVAGDHPGEAGQHGGEEEQKFQA